MVEYQQNPYIQGRDSLLRELKEKLLETQPKKFNHRIAIYGLAGVGKTQVAIEYLYRNKAEYRSIFWINASDQAAFFLGFQDIAATTKCVSIEGQTPSDIANGVLSWLAQQDRWLLVIDNLDDISIAKDHLPSIKEGDHVLITTRNPDASSIPAEGMQVPLLEEDDAIELLGNRCNLDYSEYPPSEKASAVELVRELGYLPLAIEQASGYIRLSVKSISKFLPIFRASRKQLLGRIPIGTPYPVSLYTTILLSIEKVKQMPSGEQAVKLLRLFAFLNPDGILQEFLRQGCLGLGTELQEIISNKFIFYEALGSLQQISLVNQPQHVETIVVHRLIQAITKEELSDILHTSYMNEVIGLCYQAFPEASYETRQQCRTLQNQVVEPAFEAAEVKTETAGQVLDRIGYFLRQDGKFEDALRLTNRSVQNFTTLLREEHPSTLRSMSNLAVTYHDQGKLGAAAELEEKVVEARRRTLGEEHPDTLTSIANLAVTYHHQGKLGAAAELEKKVVEARRRTLGEEHPDTLASIGNLASR